MEVWNCKFMRADCMGLNKFEKGVLDIPKIFFDIAFDIAHRYWKHNFAPGWPLLCRQNKGLFLLKNQGNSKAFRFLLKA